MAFEDLTRDALAENVGTKFRVAVESGEAPEIELVEVSEEVRGGGSRRFAIYFRGAPTFFMPQRTYRLEHATLGEFDLFIVPIARDAEGFRYEAVFNFLG